MLEPVARSIPGTEGVVDLYLMPAYDDLATLAHDGKQWNLQLVFSNDRSTELESEPSAMPFSKLALEEVLGELTRRAA